MNIWSMDENGADKRQHTFHKGWDVISASHDKQALDRAMGLGLQSPSAINDGNRLVLGTK